MMDRATAIELFEKNIAYWEDEPIAKDVVAADRLAIAALRDQQGYSPTEKTPPDHFLAQNKWGSVRQVERRSWGDRDWLVGGLYIPKDIVWWWPLPEPVGGADDAAT